MSMARAAAAKPPSSTTRSNTRIDSKRSILSPVSDSSPELFRYREFCCKETVIYLFMKNLSVAGGMLLISALGAGPLSLDPRR